MADDDRFLGTWALVPELSLYETGTPPASGCYTIAEPTPGHLALAVYWQSEADGPLRETRFGGPADGTAVPLTSPGKAPSAPRIPDALTLSRIDAHTLDSAALFQGTIITYARRVASADGALLAVVQEQTTDEGRRTRNFQLYRRVE